MSPRLRLTAAMVLLSGAMTASALERPELLPAADTYLRITQAQQLWNAFDRAYGDRMRADQQLQDFTDAFSKKVKKKILENDKPPVSLQLFEIYRILGGEIVSVYNSEGEASQSDTIFLVASATEEEFKQIIDRTAWLHGQWDEEVVRRRESFQQTELVADIMSGGSTNGITCWMAHINGTLLLSSEREWIEQTLVRVRNETVREPDHCRLSMRFPIGIWSRNDLNDEDKRAATEAFWGALGLLDIEDYTLEIELAGDDLIVDGKLQTANMQNGLFNLLDTEPADFTDDRVVPASATSLSYGKINPAGFWQKVPEILGRMTPQHSAGFMGLITFFEQQSGLLIGPDLMDHAGSRFTLHTELVGTNQHILFSLDLIDGKAVEDSLIKLLGSPFARSWASRIKVSDFRDLTFFQLKTSESGTDPPSLCVTGKKLLLGNHDDVVRNAVLRLENDARPEQSVLQREARRRAPESAFGYGGMDHRRASALIYINLSDSKFMAGIGFTSAPGAHKKENLGENEISLYHLSSYLNNTYHYAEAVPGGIRHRLIIETEENEGAP